MLIGTILSYLPYASVTAFTPGPNNIIAMYAVSQGGWKKGGSVLLGIGAGFLSVMFLCAVFCYELDKYIPSAYQILKYVGAAYILWLALHVARSGPADSTGQEMGFWSGFLLQFVNVKIIMYSLTAYNGYILPVSGRLGFLLAHAICFTVIGMAGTITWAIAGGIFQKFLIKHYRPFNFLMGLILILCAVQLL